MDCKAEHEGCKVLKYIGWTILGIGLAFLFGLFIKWLWNALMPDIFGLTELTYWQAVGLTILARILFGGFPRGAEKNTCNCEDTKKETVNSES